MKPYEKNVMQVPEEIDAFCEVVQASGARSYLEIGSKFGGSLWRVGKVLPPGSRIVAIDMPRGTKAWPESRPSLEMCVQDLKFDGYDAHLIWGKSQDMATIKRALALGPYDVIMIDADHRLPGLAADWDNYQHMSNSMVAFHDIAWHRAKEWEGVRIDVPQFWAELKKSFPHHSEFKFCPTRKNNGIGVLWKC